MVPQAVITPPVPQAITQSQIYILPSVQLQPAPVFYVPQTIAKQPIQTLSLSLITRNGQFKPKLQIDYHSSVILEGKNIQRFLMVQEDYLGVRIIDTDHIQIDGLRIGTTFLHIWDDSGRHTFYVEVVFPQVSQFFQHASSDEWGPAFTAI